jgi:SM-20-related protein
MHTPSTLLDDTRTETFDSIADSIANQGYFLWENALPKKWVVNLREFAKQERNQGAFQTAGIGKLHHFTVDKSVRGDAILWIDEDLSNDYLAQIETLIDELRVFLNRTCYLGLRDYEMHLAVYPPGAFYKRHADRFKLNAHRHISFVFYLNPDWEPGHGGELKIYLEDGSTPVVEPRGGTLIVFRSELEHEVLLANQARYSLTGWMLDIEKGMTFLKPS